ncbi:MAG: YqaA family protein [Candidatus Marisimplicoccus sp.]|jgi:membrane protein YqaA with SNARE-associated domain|tara:strand:+ start:50 stop:511 length:462 start_codon:yes stop_codon:yes gene_type:complete
MESFAEWGYLGLFFASFLAATIIPFLSSEALLSLMIVNQYSLGTVLLVATIGNWLGGLSCYYIGWLGKWDLIEKHLKIKVLTLERLKPKVDRWGAPLAFFCWIPVIGDPLAVGLGLFKTNPISVALWILIGKGIRYLVWAYITFSGMNFYNSL